MSRDFFYFFFPKQDKEYREVKTLNVAIKSEETARQREEDHCR